jgi:Tol biopolymer transport system component
VISCLLAACGGITYDQPPDPPPLEHPTGVIAFERSVAPGVGGDIFTIRGDGTGEVRVTTTNNAGEPRWSPDGTKIVFAGRGPNGIGTMTATGANIIFVSTQVDYNPAWSPDGMRIAFTGTRDLRPVNLLPPSTDIEIYTMNADGSSQTRITGSVDSESEPAWSPDGKKIAFASNRNGGGVAASIYAMNTDGTGAEQLTSGSDGGPAWSPDGTKIAFFRFAGNVSAIYTMSADGSGLTKLTDGTTSDTYPAWSPDGKWIAFASNRAGGFNQQIYVMKADGTLAQRVTVNGGTDRYPSWKPN